MLLYKLTLLSVLAGFLIDCALGDPRWLYHPVMLIGKLISALEKGLRKRFSETPHGRRAAGAWMTALVLTVTGAVVFGILFGAWLLHPWAYFGVSTVMCWQIFAARCLATEANKVVHTLETRGLEEARKQVGMLVGRDTDRLGEAQVLKATVETVAENTTDGVIAPLVYMVLFGALGGFLYKAVNTMDSMVGYKNDRYLDFGRAAAKTDDVWNYVPSRLAALGMIAASAVLGFDGRNAARIWKRDRRKHASPNSAQTESVCAGALHIELAGPASYFGKTVRKPVIGDDDRAIARTDVRKSCLLMYGTAVLWLLLFEAVGLGALLLWRLL